MDFSQTNNACVGRFFRIFAITTVRGYIFRLEKTRRIPDPFSPSVKSLRFLKSAACTISTNDTPPETGTLSLREQTCADLRPRSCQRLQNIPGITLTNADPRYLISDSECFHFSFGRVDRESVSHQIFSRHRSRWTEVLVAVKPETVVGWHRAGFRLFWRWQSRAPAGRPKTTAEIRALIHRLAEENATWGAPRIHGELQKLGFVISERTVARYLQRVGRRGDSHKAWLTFLRNHREVIAAFDFFTIPTVTFQVLYCFFVIEHGRRKILHFNVTRHPTAEWVVQQLREAFFRSGLLSLRHPGW